MHQPPSAYAEESAMVAGALRGDDRAIRELSTRLQCVDRMLHERNRRGGKPLDAHELEDLGQEIRTAIFERLDRYRPVAAFSSWVYGFCEYYLRNAARAKKRRPTQAQLHDVATEPTDEPRFFDHVHSGIARLEEVDQLIVRMKHFDGLTLEAIAAQIGMKVNTLKSRYFRALNRLRHTLSPHVEADV